MARTIHLFGVGLIVVLASVGAVGCVDHQKAGPVPEPVFYAKNVKAYGETAAGLPPDVVYAWDLRVAGDVARFYECTAIDECGKVERTRAAKEVLAVQKAGKAEVEGEVVQVMKLSLSPRPTYIVPSWKPSVR